MRRVFSSDGLAGELVFRLVRTSTRIFLFRWFRLRHEGRERLRVEGPVILAPVHRSNLDGPLIGSMTHRRVRYMGKESLFAHPVGGWIMRALGSFPVSRGEANLDAMRAAKTMLDDGEALLIFPEGTRQEGNDVGEVYDGTAFLASWASAVVVPVGAVGTEAAMPSGAKFPRRSQVAVVVGEPIAPPQGVDGRRAKRSDLKAWTDELRAALTDCQKRAEALAAR